MALTTSAHQILRKADMDGRPGIPEEYWELVERFRPELIEQAYVILGSHEDAEDVAQETFYDAARDPERLKRAESLGAWLHALNRDNALNRLRSRSRAARKSERKKIAVQDEAFTTGGFSTLELRDSIAQALKELPPELQTIVKLRYFENLSYQEIAKRLQLEEGAVERRLVHASKQLYARLKVQFPPKGQP